MRDAANGGFWRNASTTAVEYGARPHLARATADEPGRAPLCQAARESDSSVARPRLIVELDPFSGQRPPGADLASADSAAFAACHRASSSPAVQARHNPPRICSDPPVSVTQARTDEPGRGPTPAMRRGRTRSAMPAASRQKPVTIGLACLPCCTRETWHYLAIPTAGGRRSTGASPFPRLWPRSCRKLTGDGPSSK